MSVVKRHFSINDSNRDLRKYDPTKKTYASHIVVSDRV